MRSKQQPRPSYRRNSTNENGELFTLFISDKYSLANEKLNLLKNNKIDLKPIMYVYPWIVAKTRLPVKSLARKSESLNEKWENLKELASQNLYRKATLQSHHKGEANRKEIKMTWKYKRKVYSFIVIKFINKYKYPFWLSYF